MTKLKLYAGQAPGYYFIGLSDGLNQTLLFHYSSFKKVHPRANDRFWDPALSWTNKGTNFFSRTAFVGFSDGHHLTRSLGRSAHRFNTMLAPKIVIPGQKWYWYIVDFTTIFLIESAGFHTTYSLLYKR